MHETEPSIEADRVLTICNACRYCEGLCAVFPAMELRRAFTLGDLNYMANLCHGCGACYYDCQFSPPHEFAVDVPLTLAKLRYESYGRYTWPRSFAKVFERNGLVIGLVAALSVALFIIGFITLNDAGALFRTYTDGGAFYVLMPHQAMAGLFGAAFLYAVFVMAMGFRLFLRDTGSSGNFEGRTWTQALRDAMHLRYLDGGGYGCMNETSRPTDRRLYHHLTFYGFLLCFASTSTATVYHYALGREAPYPWWDLPVLLGTAGGLGLTTGTAGLLFAKLRRDAPLRDGSRMGMDVAFILMLFLTALTGLLLLALRATPAMGTLLAVHLGVVFALFITMPYGKFVHGLYRFGALLLFAREMSATHSAGVSQVPKAAPAGG